MFKDLYRAWVICYIIRQYRIDKFLIEHYNLKFLKIISWLLFWVPARNSKQSIGVRLRYCLETLGPLATKLGQLLSLQDDFLSRDVSKELISLQDNLEFVPEPNIHIVLEQELHNTIEPNSLFTEIKTVPIASASVATVYEAWLDVEAYNQLVSSQKKSKLQIYPKIDYNHLDNNSTEQVRVVIKVIRPNVREAIERDLRLLKRILEIISTYLDRKNRLRAQEIFTEIQNDFNCELNLIKEGNNAYTFREQWCNSQILYIPQVYLASNNLLVMEFIEGTRPNDGEYLEQQNVNLKLLAERGVEIFFTQLLKFNFFHADMHPGNIFLDATNKETPSYKAVDFGIVGSLDEEDRRYLIENLIAFFTRDYQRMVKLHLKSGWIQGKINEHDLEFKVRETLEPLFNQPLSKINFSHVLQSSFEIGRDFGCVVQPQLLLLQKTLVYIERMGRTLYPELDLWATAKPFLEHWFATEYSISNQAKKMVTNVPHVLNTINQMPDTMYRTKQELRSIQLKLFNLEQLILKLYRLISILIVLILILVIINIFF